MNDMSKWQQPGEQQQQAKPPARRTWPWLLGLVLLVAAGAAWYKLGPGAGLPAAQASAPPPPPAVTVSLPLQRDLDRQVTFLGQFSAVDRVELRAQVGGTLTEIHFQDGQLVRKGDLLFVIDPRPYEIRLAQAQAELETATARLDLAKLQLDRAQTLGKKGFSSGETVDQRSAELASAQAEMDQAKAQIDDARLDLEYTRVTAPFTGRIGARQVSIGSLVAGSRGGTSATSLLATLVSLDPIYLDFDMSEQDYLVFSRERAKLSGDEASKVLIALGDEDSYGREGTLDFVDNALDRSSGTIHARATVPNADLFLTAGAFARLRLAVAPPAPVLLVPDAAVLLDQSQRLVLTVAADGTVVPKAVQTGDMRGGLRVITAGLDPGDRVIIDGIVRAVPGGKVTPQDGAISYDATADSQS